MTIHIRIESLLSPRSIIIYTEQHIHYILYIPCSNSIKIPHSFPSPSPLPSRLLSSLDHATTLFIISRSWTFGAHTHANLLRRRRKSTLCRVHLVGVGVWGDASRRTLFHFLMHSSCLLCAFTVVFVTSSFFFSFARSQQYTQMNCIHCTVNHTRVELKDLTCSYGSSPFLQPSIVCAREKKILIKCLFSYMGTGGRVFNVQKNRYTM